MQSFTPKSAALAVCSGRTAHLHSSSFSLPVGSPFCLGNLRRARNVRSAREDGESCHPFQDREGHFLVEPRCSVSWVSGNSLIFQRWPLKPAAVNILSGRESSDGERGYGAPYGKVPFSVRRQEYLQLGAGLPDGNRELTFFPFPSF